MIRRALAVLALVAVSAPAAAQGTTMPPFFALEITNIGASGVDGRTVNNRIYWAYPAFTYNIRAAVVGGVYPFTYSLSNEPAGMTIDEDTGEITWLNPTSDATNIVLTVTDSASPTPAQDTATWSIDVDSTRFKFIDAVNGVNASNNGCVSSCGTGSVSAPWREFLDLVLNDTVTTLTYFRTGSYLPEDASGHGSAIGGGGREQAIHFSSNAADSTRGGSTIWLAYPGESPILELGGDQTTEIDGWGVRMTSDDSWIDGFEVQNASCLGFQFDPGSSFRGATLRNNAFHDLGPGANGYNCAFIDTRRSPPAASYGMVIQDNTFDDMNIDAYDDAVPVKLYSQNKTLIEDNTFLDGWGILHLKHDCRRFTVRANTILIPGVGVVAIGGNMDRCQSGSGCDAATDTSYGEITFNNVRIDPDDSSHAGMDINQAGTNHITHIYRNTIHGFFRFRNVGAANTYGPGPFYVSRNVIVNGGAGSTNCSDADFDYFNCETVTDFSRITLNENLEGNDAANIIDANGLLQGSYRTTYLGLRGHELADVEEPPAPTTGRRLRFRTP